MLIIHFIRVQIYFKNPYNYLPPGVDNCKDPLYFGPETVATFSWPIRHFWKLAAVLANLVLEEYVGLPCFV
jgi:hypothetical protein